MSLSGIRDVDREILKHADDSELLKICSVNRKTWNEVCDDNFLRRRLSVKYPGVEKYKKQRQSWKHFYLRFVYYTAKMQEMYEYTYESGDFKRQYDLLKDYEEDDDLLIESSISGEFSLVKYVLKRGADIHAENDEALQVASANGYLEIVKYLIEHGADIHAREELALGWAAENGHLDIVKYLIERGADIHAIDESALLSAAENGHFEVVKYLVQHGANPHAQDDEALRLARLYGYSDIVRYIESFRR